MNDFCIQINDGVVRVNRIIGTKLEPITIKGELELPASIFWGEFKSKIEYEEGDELSFLFIGNTCDFAIDPSIEVASQFSVTSDELSIILSTYCEGTEFSTLPEVDVNIDVVQESNASLQSTVSSQTLNEKLDEAHPESIQSFYRNKTKALRS